ncbi:MAG: hypothetical protein JWM96_1005 [Alphaproteobacteria bacterium]|nr:hypothetical protein [Alphaproteobacteria bacterium]
MQNEILTGAELLQAQAWLEQAAIIARKSHCCRRRCGSILVDRTGNILAAAENKLPGKPGQAEIHCNPYQLHEDFKSDKGCCIHSEERLVMQALAEGKDFAGSTLVFTSVDEAGQRLQSGRPYCTICSKIALEAGVNWWILEHEEGIIRYEAAAYNTISFSYSGG